MEVKKRSGDIIFVLCPFHNEKTPSCAIYSNNRFYCFGCSEFGNAQKFLNQLDISDKDIELSESLTDYKYYERKRKKAIPSSYSITALHRNLLKKPQKQSYLLEKRHFNSRAIIDSGIGYGDVSNLYRNYIAPRYSIPFYDENNKIVNVRYRIDPLYDNDKEPRYLAYPNAKTILYNLNILKFSKNLIYVGSQLDAAALYYGYNIRSVASASETVFLLEWAKLFDNKNVLIWLDNDETGYKFSLKIYNQIKKIANKVDIFTWGIEFNDGDDVTDFMDIYDISGILDVLDRYKIYAGME
jgi:DNA primase